MAKVNKGVLNSYFETGDYPTQNDFKSVQDSCLGVLDSASELPAPSAEFVGNEYKIGNVFYKCVLSNGAYTWQQTGTATPSNDYTDILNKPRINGAVLTQGSTLDDIGAVPVNAPSLTEKIPLEDTDLCYVHSNGQLYKSSIGALRKPHTEQVTISAADWTLDGEKYIAVKSVNGINATSIAVVTPDSVSIEAFMNTPFWAQSLGENTITFATSSVISDSVIANIMYW